MEHHHELFLSVAEVFRGRSPDLHTQHGCVVVNKQGVIIGAGYNGFPHKIEVSSEMLTKRPEKYVPIIHAEDNAVTHASGSVMNCSVYVTGPPCSDCLRRLVFTGVKQIIFGDVRSEADSTLSTAEMRTKYSASTCKSDSSFIIYLPQSPMPPRRRFPIGTPKPIWNEMFFGALNAVKQPGCFVVDKYHRIVGGAFAEQSDSLLCPFEKVTASLGCRVVQGCEVFSTNIFCINCLKRAVQCEIKSVYYLNSDESRVKTEAEIDFYEKLVERVPCIHENSFKMK